MNKIIYLLATAVLIISIGYFYLVYQQDLKGITPIKNTLQKQSGISETFSVNVDKDRIHSNLYPPADLAVKTATSSVTLTWNFKQAVLTAENSEDQPYITHSGFRIFRDGSWYTDIPADQSSFTDEYLFPDEEYSYMIAPLTFDNKIEGSKSATIKSKTLAAEPVYKRSSVSKYSSYLAAGDSITEGQRAAPQKGWVDQVAAYLKKASPQIEVTNKGITGTTTTLLEQRIIQEIEETHPDLISIEVGINDLIAGFETDNGRVKMADVKDNFRKMIRASKSAKATVLILSIPYQNCCQKDWTKNGDKRVAWNKLIRDTAYELGLQSIDIYSPMKGASNEQALADDLLHPSQKGHDIIADTVIQHLEQNEKDTNSE